MGASWDQEAVEYLRDSVGMTKVSTIAANLGKSYTAVELKMKRMNLYHTKNQTGFLTMGELANILGVERNTVKGWMLRHEMPCHRKITKEKKKFYLIHPTEFWDWAKDHKEKIQFSDIEPHSLIPEPSWVNRERRREKELSLMKKRKYKSWTTLADRELLDLRQRGLTFNEIGEKLDRSPLSVERRYHRIKDLYVRS
ncbi:helix-turn-helix domain-containing protein [Virgibacillus sediminis]|uniref:Helix-turn-helix domain-containing protein n=1 Tax=Virgibacillus sediminis TaxID=202260 RepID=A0ABV7A8G0_9BACI